MCCNCLFWPGGGGGGGNGDGDGDRFVSFDAGVVARKSDNNIHSVVKNACVARKGRFRSLHALIH